MFKRIVCSLLLFPLIGFCSEQQYVISNGSGQTLPQQIQAQLRNQPIVAPHGAMNIYLSPQQQYASQQSGNNNANQQANNSNQSPENLYQPKKQDWWENTNKQKQQTIASQSQPQQQAATMGAAVQNQNVTTNNQQQWLQNCVNSVTDPKVVRYAQKFCACGWRHISGGELPLNYLTSNSPTDIKNANTILRVIKEQCMAEVVA